MAQYGVGSLRASVARASMLMRNEQQQQTASEENQSRRASVMSRLSHRFSSSMSSQGAVSGRMSAASGRSNETRRASIVRRFSHRRSSSMSTNNATARRSRAVLYKGLAYSGAYMFCYMPYFVTNIVYTFIDKKKPFPLILSFQICVPLQGLFNFAIFLHPKVVSVRKRGDISLFRAIFRAMKSRGNRNRSRRTSVHSGGRRRTSLRNSGRRRGKRVKPRLSFRETLKRRSRQVKRFSKNFSVFEAATAAAAAGQQQNSSTPNSVQSENDARELQRIYRELAERNVSSALSSTLSANSSVPDEDYADNTAAEKTEL